MSCLINSVTLQLYISYDGYDALYNIYILSGFIDLSYCLHKKAPANAGAYSFIHHMASLIFCSKTLSAGSHSTLSMVSVVSHLAASASLSSRCPETTSAQKHCMDK